MADRMGGRSALRNKLVKRSVETFDWPILERHLTAIAFNADTGTELIALLRRNDQFIIKGRDDEREVARMAFVGHLLGFLSAKGVMDVVDRMNEFLVTLTLIEKGYREITRTSAGVEAARLLPEVRVSAALRRAAANYHALVRDLDSRTRRRRRVTLQGLRVTRADGTSYSPDGVLAGIGQVTALVLRLLAREHGWFDREGRLLLPGPTATSDDDLYKAGLTELLAVSWRHWERMEQRCRYFGGRLVAHGAGDLPGEAPSGTETFVTYDDVSDPEVLDHVANQRLNDRMVQTFQEMLLQTNAEAKVVPLADSPDLPPSAYVSPQEAHAGVALSEALGYSIVDDQEAPCGLRLIEWIRGHSVLQVLATAEYETRGEQGLCTRFKREDLSAVLLRSGLGHGRAERFIALTTLGRSSRDLFDQPLIQGRDGSLFLFGPGVLNADPSRQTLSAIAAKGEALSRKGKAFEGQMSEFFRDRGLGAVSTTFRRDGEEYDYDLLVPWEGHLFIFECKNRALSGHHIPSAYHFSTEMDAAKAQVRRLVDGLSRYAAVILERTGLDVRDMKVVPCVLSSLPYASEGGDCGIPVVDASALKRFFQERHIHLVRPHWLRQDRVVLHRTAVASLWASDRPTATDLVAYLNDLPQLRLAMAHVDVVRHGFGLGERTVAVVSDLANKEPSVDSVSRLFSVDPRRIEREGDAFTHAMGGVRRRQERRMVIEADRAWRRRR